MRNHRRASLVALAICATQLLAGCNDEPAKSANTKTSSTDSGHGGAGGSGGTGGTGGIGVQQTGARFLLNPGEDVSSVDFMVKRVTCNGEPIEPFTATKNVPVSMPGGSVLVDYFLLLEPGCYDVVAQPLDIAGNPSKTCSAAYYDDMVIVDGTTTEVGLVSQCDGKPMGAGDIWFILNHPPVINKVTFTPDKWTPYCREQTVCVEFKDEDGDPVDIEWAQLSGAPLASGPNELPAQFDPATGITTQCATLTHSAPGTVALEVTAYDLMQAPGGGLMRVEDFFKSLGLPYTSHDSLSFPSHGISTPNCPCVPSAEICDNIDNDCDGLNNEGLTCACLPFETVSCYEGPAGTAGVGACRSGGRTCKFDGSGFNSECNGDVLPSLEQCNSKDDDCDGQINEGLTCLSCTPPAVQDCAYSGPPGTQNVGECRAPQQFCLSSNQWGACVGEVLPINEIANNLKDDDCDGLTDESVGDQEICNGQDDDADGQIDENLGTTSCGVGACATTVQNCVNGQAQTCTPLPPTSDDICGNGIDDDCDGLMDDGCDCTPGDTQACYSGAPNTQGVGICGGGTQTCQLDGEWGPCLGEVVPMPAEVCGDNLDNDCNGETDESPPCPPPPPGLCSTGCNGGVADGVCMSGENAFNCAADCACGDGICSGLETAATCHVDCKFSSDLNGMCGNGHCDPWEVDYTTAMIHCQQDCWDGVVLAGAVCGNGSCTPQEDATNCPADCGNAKAYVNGNDICEPGEHWSTSVDCAKHIEAGTFLKAECEANSYALVATYADGNGGTTSHTITNCSESCGAAPWKMLAPNWSNTSFDGVQVLRPDCSICTMTNPPIANIVGDSTFWGGWVSVYQQSTYEMDMDPNKCNLAAHPYNFGTPWYSYVVPLEWEKVEEKNCAQSTCDVRDCAGNHYPQNSGVVGIWKPAYGSWSMYEAYCQ